MRCVGPIVYYRALIGLFGLLGCGGCGVFFSLDLPDPVVPPPLSASLTAERYQFFAADGPAGVSPVRAVPVGGTPPYTFAWSVIGPDGRPDNSRLDTLDLSVVRFTVGSLFGPYRLNCLITDSVGEQYTASAILQHGEHLGLDLTTERFGVIAGGGPNGRVTLHLNPSFGTAPFNVEWVCTGPDGRVDNERLDVTDPMSPRFTSSDQVGTYVLTASITDTRDETATQSIVVVVGQTLGADVATDRVRVLPGGGDNGMANLLATAIGGTVPYAYDWEVIGPDGGDRTDLLWDRSVRDPIFESDDVTGPFIARCAITDAAGTVLIGSTNITVGQEMILDVRTDRIALPLAGGAEGNQVASLRAEVRGGNGGPFLSWKVTGPNGEDASSLLSSTSEAAIIFSPGGAAAGSYLVRCTATDTEGRTAVDSLTLTVGGTLGLVISTSNLSPTTGGGDPVGKATLTTRAYGGVPPYSYAWTVTSPSGVEEPERLDSTTVAEPVFTSSTQAGQYSLVCIVTDAMGDTAVDAIILNVGQPLNVDVSVDKQSLTGAGGVSGQAQIITSVIGGVTPYTYSWSVIDPNQAYDLARLSSTTIANPVFSSTLIAGTYRLTLTTTDAMGVVFVDSVELVVGSTGGGAAGQNLSAAVSIDKQSITTAAEAVTARCDATGGVFPLNYVWSVTGPSGEVADARLNTTTGDTAVFTSNNVQGTYRVQCTVSDVIGNMFTDSTQLTVSDRFLLDVSASQTFLPPGQTVDLVADRTGGVGPFTYTWNCVNLGDAAAGTFASGSIGVGAASTVSADDATNTWTAPAGAGALGAYRITVTATDAEGDTYTTTVHVTVSDSFLLDMTASRTLLPPGGTVVLQADRTGGEAAFTYAWTCINESSAAAGTFALGSTGPGVASTVAPDDASNTWTAPVGAGTLGSYRLTVVATDARGNTFTDSVHVNVIDIFQLDLLASPVFLSPGSNVNLLADRTGGEANFTYAWSCLNASNAAAGAFAFGSTGPGAASTVGADDSSNTWTAPVGAGALGSYRIQVTATDARGQVFVDTAHVTVSDNFLLDVSTTRVQLAPGAAVVIRADMTGGEGPFTCAWTALNESGAGAGAFTTGPTAPGQATSVGAGDLSNTWTAPFGPGALGNYRITVLATDNRGSTFTDTVELIVSDSFFVDLSGAQTHLAPGAALSLQADRTGGEGPYSYAWRCVDSTGAAAGAFTSGPTGPGAALTAGADDASNTWTAPVGVGTTGAYRITVTATDARGQVFTDNFAVTITDTLLADLTTTRAFITPGESVTLTADRTGGAANFTYQWTCVNTSGAAAGAFAIGSGGPGLATQVVANDATNAWTAPAAATGTLGTYTIAVDVTDSNGITASDIITVIVHEPFSLDLVTDNYTVAAGGAVTLTANRSGGERNFSYFWTARNPSGAVAGTWGSGSTGPGEATQAGQAGDASNTWTAPAAGAGVSGTYRITCVASDNLGQTFTDSAVINVGSTDPLLVEVRSSAVFLEPGETINLTADQTGGVANFSYAWSATDEAGAAGKGTFAADNQAGQPGDAANTWTAPAIAADVLGTYRIGVTTTDALGRTATDVLHVVVVSNLSMNLTVNDPLALPSTAITATAAPSGGEPPYSYAWQAYNSAGALAGAFTVGSTGVGEATQAGEPAAAVNTWSSTTEGRYMLVCTVTDNDGQVFTDSVQVHLTATQALVLDLTADLATAWPGEVVTLTADRSGGVANFNYAWTIVDESGGGAAGLAAANQNGLPGDAVNTWTVPTTDGVEGTYRITCTLTDGGGRTFVDSTSVVVRTLATQNVFLAPPATVASVVLADTGLDNTATGGDPGLTLLPVDGLTNPAHPRNVVLTLTDADNSVGGGTARITGLDARGFDQSEVVTLPASAGGFATVTGVKPFAAVTRVELFNFAGVINPFGFDTLAINAGLKFGLTGTLGNATDVLYVVEGSSAYTAGHVVDTTAGQQGITFQNAPNGARNYVVVFRPR